MAIATKNIQCGTESISTLGIIVEMPVTLDDAGRIRMHMSFGRIVDELAGRYDKVRLCGPTSVHGSVESCDYALEADNVELISQPLYRSSLASLKLLMPICMAYVKTLRSSQHIFVRGMLPYSGLFYLLASCHHHKPVHWVVGDPIALLKAKKRSSWLADAAGLLYAYQDRLSTIAGRRISGGGFICNGSELARIYRSPRTKAVVSTTIKENEIFVRTDTCLADQVRLLFVGFVRPEKGLEYLIEALPKLQIGRPWHLTIVGPWERYEDYKSHLDACATRLGVDKRITWAGYVKYGPDLWGYLREQDVLLLPSLSEGTPRVLVEARANSLPVVATNVGGIPTSIRDGIDGLLVAPKDAEGIASAIARIVCDSTLRRSLIQNGLQTARSLTVDKFVDDVVDLL